MGIRGEIVEVEGGHIVRSIGRKDRHSKVCTAKGARDRRVRLSAHTAIEFYDVQDRLGYDRPSKAVDWLIKKAKAAIDELEELPPWKPTIGPIGNGANFDQEREKEEIFSTKHDDVRVGLGDSVESGNERFSPSCFQDSDKFGDTMKSFFPMGGGMEFQSFQESNLVSRTSSQSQDLRLSLQSFQDPVLLHHHNPTSHSEQGEDTHFQESYFFTGSTTPLIGFDASLGCWSEHQHQPVELSRMQRLAAAAAHVGGDYPTGGTVTGAGGGYLFNSPPVPPLMLQQLFGHGQNQFFTQRGPLQSSYSPSIRAWIDPTSAIAIATGDPIHHQAVLPMYSASISGIGFASEVGGFSGFRIPTRIQGEIEEHDGISDKLSSVSSDSRH